jgi:hypothetical protein
MSCNNIELIEQPQISNKKMHNNVDDFVYHRGLDSILIASCNRPFTS